MVLQTSEIMLILVVVLLLFGASSIPKLMRSLGRAQGEFNRAKREFDQEVARSESGITAATTTATGTPSEDQVRRTARDLGIAESGKPLDQVKREIQQKLA